MDAADALADVAADGPAPDAATAAWWDAWQIGVKQEWSARAAVDLVTWKLAALATRGTPEGELDPSRPAAPDLSAEVWALIMDRLSSCRCARAWGGPPPACIPFLLP